MAREITIILCSYYKREAEALLNFDEFKEIKLITINGYCGRPIIDSEELKQFITPKKKFSKINIFCGNCMERSLEDKGRVNFISHEKCFKMVISGRLIDNFIKDGFYLITPGWLADWEEWIGRRGHDRETVIKRFKDDYSCLLLLDTGVYNDCTKTLKEFADYLEMPYRIISVGIDFMKLYIGKYILESRLKEAETGFRMSFEKTNDSIFWADRETGVIINCNKVLEVILNRNRDEIIGKPLSEIFPPGKAAEYSEKLVDNSENLDSIEYDTEIISKSGKAVPVHLSVSYSNIDGRLILQGIFRDITLRKKSEGDLRKLFLAVEQSPVNIVITDSEGVIEYVNPIFTQITGYSLGEAIGQNPRILKSEKHGNEFYKGLWDTIKSGNVWRGEFFNKKKNGDLYWESASISPVKDEEDNITHFVAVKEDITEQKMAEIKLKEYAEELERSNRELDDFAYIASHDLKEPLRGIHNYSVFLLEDYGDIIDKEGRGKLETLVRLSKRQGELINSLLIYSRVGRLDLDLKEVDFNEIVRDAVDSLAMQIKENNVDIRIKDNLPSIICDRIRMQEVMTNLISNSLKYNDKPQKIIEIGCSSEESTGKYQFYVRDNGIGIEEKHLESIFRIFKRLHGRDEYGGGTGAGLTIVKKILERHRGALRVESKPGEGSTFYFTLNGKNFERKQ